MQTTINWNPADAGKPHPRKTVLVLADGYIRYACFSPRPSGPKPAGEPHYEWRGTSNGYVIQNVTHWAELSESEPEPQEPVDDTGWTSITRDLPAKNVTVQIRLSDGTQTRGYLRINGIWSMDRPTDKFIAGWRHLEKQEPAVVEYVITTREPASKKQRYVLSGPGLTLQQALEKVLVGDAAPDRTEGFNSIDGGVWEVGHVQEVTNDYYPPLADVANLCQAIAAEKGLYFPGQPVGYDMAKEAQDTIEQLTARAQVAEEALVEVRTTALEAERLLRLSAAYVCGHELGDQSLAYFRGGQSPELVDMSLAIKTAWDQRDKDDAPSEAVKALLRRLSQVDTDMLYAQILLLEELMEKFSDGLESRTRVCVRGVAKLLGELYPLLRAAHGELTLEPKKKPKMTMEQVFAAVDKLSESVKLMDELQPAQAAEFVAMSQEWLAVKAQLNRVDLPLLDKQIGVLHELEATMVSSKDWRQLVSSDQREAITGVLNRISHLYILLKKARGTLETKNGHQLFTNDDDCPASILDSNGEVVLSMCKVCGKAESELDGPCKPKKPKMTTEQMFAALDKLSEPIKLMDELQKEEEPEATRASWDENKAPWNPVAGGLLPELGQRVLVATDCVQDKDRFHIGYLIYEDSVYRWTTPEGTELCADAEYGQAVAWRHIPTEGLADVIDG